MLGLATVYINMVIRYTAKIFHRFGSCNIRLSGESVGLMTAGTRFENLDFVRNLLFSLLKNAKSVADERGHR